MGFIVILFLIGGVLFLCADKDWHIYAAGLCIIASFCLTPALVLSGSGEPVEAKNTAAPRVEESEEYEVPGLRYGPHFDLYTGQYEFYGLYYGNDLYGWDLD